VTPRTLAPAIAALSIAACGDDAPAPGCRFGEEHTVGGIGGTTVDDLVLAPTRDGAVVAWSAREGTFLLELDDRGVARAPAHRLTGRCGGGIALAADARAAWLACSVRPIEAADKPGAVHVVRIARGEVDLRCSFGRVGSASHGIDMALHDGRPQVAWNDADAGYARVWLARWAADARPPHCTTEPRVISRDDVRAGAPSALFDRGRLLVTWAETVTADGDSVGEVRVWADRGAATTAASVLHPDARPVLARDARGLLVGFRDENPAGTRPRLFLIRLDEGLGPASEPVRVGRANGEGGVALAPCAERLFTIAPRTFDRDGLIGINVLDGRLAHAIGEQQMYRAGGDYAWAAGVCLGDSLRVVAAERSAIESRGGRVVTASLTCRW
jgi:hypothetical protein